MFLSKEGVAKDDLSEGWQIGLLTNLDETSSEDDVKFDEFRWREMGLVVDTGGRKVESPWSDV